MSIQRFNQFNEEKVENNQEVTEVKENKEINEHQETEHYMFFANLETIKRLADEMLSMDKNELDQMLKEHDWANDHISTSKDDVEEVFNFVKSHKSQEGSNIEINKFDNFEEKPDEPNHNI